MSDSNVTTSERSTVFLRPILFISNPVGTENIRNQRNTSDGRNPAFAGDKPRSALRKFVAEPTRSTNPIAKKQSITGMICASDEVRCGDVEVAIF